jgi:hypothetical protein
MAQANDWLRHLEDQGLRDDLPTLMKGTAYSLIYELAAHPILGDFSTGVFSLQMKAAPGIAGEALATATVTSGVVAGGVNPVSISLPVAAQTGVIEPAFPPGVVDRFFTLLYAPSGGSPTLVRGGLWPVQAGVTAP